MMLLHWPKLIAKQYMHGWRIITTVVSSTPCFFPES
jgi:hypothetical protein